MTEKKKYEAPHITMIDLAAGEVLGGACKSSSAGDDDSPLACALAVCNTTVGDS